MEDPRVCGCAAALSAEGGEFRGSGPACAGQDGPGGCCVSQRRGVQRHASLTAARPEA